MMMARTASYVPKELPMSSFNLDFTDSSQEEILSQEREPGSQKGKKIYCLPPNIVNMTIENHPSGEFLQPKSKEPFMVEDYPMFIPFLDLKKLSSHPYGYVISRMRVYAEGAPLRKKDREIEPLYIDISGQKTHYNCTVYIMKWLEIIQPENIKKEKCEWDNWTQAEVDHFRIEFASRILFHCC
ncbi:hypothetical protein Ahy_B09g099351 [Arachis hypogaea]|uniref:Ubiquitin-like protease family profile domain-containing protein n=1 Tax=Arachis hypogaea TaxID=3818 RepID=A0A444XTJ7_ARAHY|nr:hypothetical protein Ahy_B09g099351 [Arachis hypogaea]